MDRADRGSTVSWGGWTAATSVAVLAAAFAWGVQAFAQSAAGSHPANHGAQTAGGDASARSTPTTGARRDRRVSADAGADVSGAFDAAGDGTPGGDDRDGGTVDAIARADGELPYDERRVLAGREFAEGMAAYRRGDYAAAARHFQDAYDALPDPAPLFNMARSFEGANDTPHAIEAYDRYLAAAPQAPDRAAVQDRLARLRARPAQIFLVTEPPGAAIFIDEQPNPHPQVTPVVLSLAPGTHTVVVEREGYRRTARSFAVRPGTTDTVTVDLIPDPSSTAAGARPRTDPRILNRRTALVAPRLSLLLGAGRPFIGEAYVFSLGAEAALYFARSFVGRLHFERFEPDGSLTILTGEFAYSVPIDDLDLSIGMHVGVAVGPRDSRLEARAERWVLPVVGLDLRLDWQFHPYLSLGVFLRGGFRNLFVSAPEFLNTFGASISLTL